MVDVSYYLQIIDDVFNCSYLKRNSKIAFIPNAKEKIFLEDMELTVKEVIYLTILKKNLS